MKIIQFIASIHRGGAEKVVASLTNAMADDSIDVELLLPKGSLIANEIDPSISVTYLHFSSRFNPLLYLELLLFFWRKKPDIVHTHAAKATALISKISPWLKAIHIATKHNARKGAIFNRLRHVTAVAKEVQNSISPTMATLIYNGIKPKDISQNILKHPNIPFKITAIGRLDPIKAYDRLIEACAKLPFTFELHLIGEGPDEQRLRQCAQTVNITSQVIFEGYQRDIAKAMLQSDLIVISSKSEGFSMVMVEALFYAPILISTKVSGSTEILDSDLLMEQDDISKKIQDVFEHYSSYQSKFERLRIKYSKKLTLKYIVSEYRTYYETALKEHSL